MGDLVRMSRWRWKVLGLGADMYRNRGAVRDVNGGAGAGMKTVERIRRLAAAAAKRKRSRKR